VTVMGQRHALEHLRASWQFSGDIARGLRHFEGSLQHVSWRQRAVVLGVFVVSGGCWRAEGAALVWSRARLSVVGGSDSCSC
jgi:hypothetical protein